MDYLIWWVSQHDTELTKKAGLWNTEFNRDGGVPIYISDEFISRYGRAGRGRLWISDDLGLPSDFAIEWKPNSTGARKLSFDDYGGIVFRAEDKLAIIHLPGIITDLNLRLIGE